MTTPDVTPSDPWALEDTLRGLLRLGRRESLPPMAQLRTLGDRTQIIFRVADYSAVRAWAGALGHRDEPERHLVGAEGIIYHSAHIPDAVGGWGIEVEARVHMPVDFPVDDDTADAVELILAEAMRS